MPLSQTVIVLKIRLKGCGGFLCSEDVFVPVPTIKASFSLQDDIINNATA